MGSFLFHLSAVFVSCVIVNIRPLDGFEFFRSLIVLSAGMGYDFWTMAQTGQRFGAKWYRRAGIVGFVFFFLLFWIGVLGLTRILELSASMTELSTTNLSIVQISIPFQGVVHAILILPVALVVMADTFFKPKDESHRDLVRTERGHRK